MGKYLGLVFLSLSDVSVFNKNYDEFLYQNNMSKK